MNNKASYLGKIQTRKSILNREKKEKEKRSKRIKRIGIALLIFALFILAFFTRAYNIAMEETYKARSYDMVKKSLKDLDGQRAFISRAYNYNRDSIRDRVNKDAIDPNRKRLAGDLDSRIKYYLRQHDIDRSQVGFAFYSPIDGVFLGINEGEKFYAASTSKVPVVMYLYDLAYEEDLDLDTRMMVKDKHMAGGTGILQDRGTGGTYSLSHLASLAITHSDNVATNMLYDFLGSYKGKYVLDALDEVYGLSTYDGNYLSPDDAYMVLNRLYKNEGSNPYYEDLLHDMETTIYNDFFTKSFNNKLPAHKTGNLNKSYNDIGIVASEGGVYYFAVFTEGLDDPVRVLNDLGKITNDWYEGK